MQHGLVLGSSLLTCTSHFYGLHAAAHRMLKCMRLLISGGVANVWSPHEEELFYCGYGNNEINTDILAYYRHERIVEDIAEYGQQLLLTSANRLHGSKNRAEMYKQFISMFDPQCVVDIAFNTDSIG